MTLVDPWLGLLTRKWQSPTSHIQDFIFSWLVYQNVVFASFSPYILKMLPQIHWTLWKIEKSAVLVPMKAIEKYVMSLIQCQPGKDPLVHPCITALDNWWGLEVIYNTSSYTYWQSSCLFLFYYVFIGSDGPFTLTNIAPLIMKISLPNKRRQFKHRSFHTPPCSKLAPSLRGSQKIHSIKCAKLLTSTGMVKLYKSN